MKTCYHHTSFDTLKKIITNNGLTFRASRYSNYENKEYTWIKDKAYKVVKEICQEQAQPFDNDLMEFNPYIICFCEEGFSKYMWSNYADKNQGIQIEVNSDILLKYSLQNQNPDAFVKCAYLSEKERENNEHIKSAITKIYNTYQVSSNLQDDLLICASCIKQDIYRSEKEYRYMIPHYNQISISRITVIIEISCFLRTYQNFFLYRTPVFIGSDCPLFASAHCLRIIFTACSAGNFIYIHSTGIDFFNFPFTYVKLTFKSNNINVVSFTSSYKLISKQQSFIM